MGAIFIKVKDESFELVDKETGEISDLYETYKIDEETWYRIYVNTFFATICEITSVKDIQLFVACLKYSRCHGEDGNIVCISDIEFQRVVENKLHLNKQNLCRSLKSLCNKGYLHKLDCRNYRINPQISYCGERHSRAKLILKLIKE